jgi:hypothetical protein
VIPERAERTEDFLLEVSPITAIWGSWILAYCGSEVYLIDSNFTELVNEVARFLANDEIV